MKPAHVPSPRYLGLRPFHATILLITIATLGRLYYCGWLPMLPDETYYLQWAKHLDASYYSKGPGIAWTIAAGTSIFGNNNFGVRFFAVMLSAGTAWQLFLLARRWFDATTGMLAVLLAGVVPIYALGAVVMTIDPLSAFFWVWAANLFTCAIQKSKLRYWLLCGFAVGSGFLAKYLNALELLAFVAFLLAVPSRRHYLAKSGFWLMLLVSALCTIPVFWWNWRHHWISWRQLTDRGQLTTAGPFQIHASTFLDFLGMQAVVISPLLFLALIIAVATVLWRKFRQRNHKLNEGELFLFMLFLPVFLMYAALSWHMRCEPNWPAVSYLSLLIILASHWRRMLLPSRKPSAFMAVVFFFAWLQTFLMHDTQYLPLPQKQDPMSRVVGWQEIAHHLDKIRKEQAADCVIADGYKEASIFSFYIPGQPFVYAIRHNPPANQYDFWPGYPTGRGGMAVWITGESSPVAMQRDFNTVTFLERVVVNFRDKPFREYNIYLCENRAPRR